MISLQTSATRTAKLMLLALVFLLSSGIASANDADLTAFYTQYAFAGTGPSVFSLNIHYAFATNAISLTNNFPIISGTSDSAFGGADGIILNPNNQNLLIAGGGGADVAGNIYQITQAGSHGSPFDVTMTPSTTAYNLILVPANGTKGGFSAGTLVATEKDFGYGKISVFSLSPLANGSAYPVNGDDNFVTGIAFGTDGTAYYGSGTETSNAGNFGIITFDGVQFITHRLFGQPVGSDDRGGVIFSGTHRLCFDPFSGDIIAVGGNTVGQYVPGTNSFHITALYGPANNFEFSTPVSDGQGHIVITEGQNNLVILDFSTAPNRLIDAGSGVQYAYVPLATNLAAITLANGTSSSGGPVISQSPQNATTLVGESANFTVSASGSSLSYVWQSKASGASSFTPIPGATLSSYTTPPAVLSDSGTQFNCVVTNGHGSVTSSAATLTVFTGSTGYVTSTSLGTLRNDYSGWVGMKIVIGNSPLTITSLGRMFVVGNSGIHTVKIVNAATGADVPNGSVAIPMSGGVSGSFVYANLSNSVNLNSNTTYYVLTQETLGGDQWYDWNTSAQTTSVASLAAAEYGPAYTSVGSSAGRIYGPVDFKYASQVLVTVAPSSVTLSNGGTQTFAATVSGTSNSAVTWSLNPAAGTIDSNGKYNAPVGISSNQTVTITATSVAVNTSSGTATVNLIPPSPPMITQQPQSTTVTLGATATFTVGASGATGYQWESMAPGGSVFNPIAGANSVSYTTPATVQADSGTQFMCIVSNNQGPASSNAAVLTVATDTPFVGSFTLGTLRNNYGGWVGMAINVGSSSLTVSSLGRMAAPGNSGSHALKIVNASTNADVNGSLITVNMAGAATGSFAYGSLNSPVILQANSKYYILSQEVAGGDQWYDLNTTVLTSAIASVTAPVYGPGGSYSLVSGMPGHSYVPVDFRSASSSAPPVNGPFVSNVSPGTSRKDFSGWVGATITTGAQSLKVTQLGRFAAAGNSGSHTVKFVNASTGSDIAGASVTVNMAGSTSGTFAYGTLSNPIILSPNTTYYLVTQETAGGDLWYDWDSTVSTNPGAFDTSSVWSLGGTTYNTVGGSANHMYGPVDFIFVAQ